MRSLKINSGATDERSPQLLDGESMEIIEPADRAKATIKVWDSSGNRKAPVIAFNGDEIEYKRNGCTGWMRCSLFDINLPRLTLMPVEGGRRFSVPVTSRGFAQLWRNGKRVLP